MAVIKADAYGHGDAHIARWLTEQEGCHMFAVSNIGEAVGLRNSGIKRTNIVLGYTSPKYVKTLDYLEDYHKQLCRRNMRKFWLLLATK